MPGAAGSSLHSGYASFTKACTALVKHGHFYQISARIRTSFLKTWTLLDLILKIYILLNPTSMPLLTRSLCCVRVSSSFSVVSLSPAVLLPLVISFSFLSLPTVHRFLLLRYFFYCIDFSYCVALLRYFLLLHRFLLLCCFLWYVFSSCFIPFSSYF